VQGQAEEWSGKLGGAGASRTTERRTIVPEHPVSEPEATEGLPDRSGDTGEGSNPDAVCLPWVVVSHPG
jgi:hypothetical protein